MKKSIYDIQQQSKPNSIKWFSVKILKLSRSDLAAKAVYKKYIAVVEDIFFKTMQPVRVVQNKIVILKMHRKKIIGKNF